MQASLRPWSSRLARGGAFVALILGLILFAGTFAEFLSVGYWSLVAAHVTAGLIAIGASYLVFGPALRGPGAAAGRVRTVGFTGAAILAVLLITGVALLAGTLAGGASDLGRYAHLVLAFLAIGALIAFGLAMRPRPAG